MLHSPRVVVSKASVVLTTEDWIKARVVCKLDRCNDISKMFTPDMTSTKYTCQRIQSPHTHAHTHTHARTHGQQSPNYAFYQLLVRMGICVQFLPFFFFKQIWVHFQEGLRKKLKKFSLAIQRGVKVAELDCFPTLSS